MCDQSKWWTDALYPRAPCSASVWHQSFARTLLQAIFTPRISGTRWQIVKIFHMQFCITHDTKFRRPPRPHKWLKTLYSFPISDGITHNASSWAVRPGLWWHPSLVEMEHTAVKIVVTFPETVLWFGFFMESNLNVSVCFYRLIYKCIHK